MTLKNYYGAKGKYLEEHKEYFSREQLNKEVDFLIKSVLLLKTAYSSGYLTFG